MDDKIDLLNFLKGHFKISEKSTPRPAFYFTGVALLTAIPFLPALSGQFLNWDDNLLLVETLNYRFFDWESIRWMLTTTHLGHYMPLTWFVYGLGFKLWGLNPVGFHSASVVLHVLNAALLYALLSKWRLPRAAFFSTLLWAWHPFRVESVAWITAFRDLLSTFWVLVAFQCLIKRNNSTVRDRSKWHLAGGGAYLLSLMSTALTVPFPMALSVYEAWRARVENRPWSFIESVIKNRVFYFFGFLFAILAFQGVVDSNAAHPLTAWWGRFAGRIFQSLYSAGFLLFNSAGVRTLSPLHPFPEGQWFYRPEIILIASATLALLVITFFCRARSWGAYCVILSFYLLHFPFSGIFQSGRQITAERYAYLATIPIVFGLSWIFERYRNSKILIGLATIFLFIFGFCSLRYAEKWKTSVDLWRNAATQHPTSAELLTQFGSALLMEGHDEEGMKTLERAHRMNPQDSKPLIVLGDYYQIRGKLDRSGPLYQWAAEVNPRSSDPWERLGQWYFAQGKHAVAIDHFQRATKLKPNSWEAYCGWGAAELGMGRPVSAVSPLREGYRLNPKSPDINNNLGSVFLALGDRSQAIFFFRKALSLSPENKVFTQNLEKAMVVIQPKDSDLPENKTGSFLKQDLDRYN